MSHRHRHARARAGFTLVESSFAATMLGVVLLGSIVLLARNTQMSQGSIGVHVAQNQAQALIYRLERELANARGERPVATLGEALGGGTGGTLRLDSTHGFPPTGLVLIDRGTDHAERIAYGTLAADGTTLDQLVRGTQCTASAAHAQGSEAIWCGLAETLSLSGNPPADLWDGRALESAGPVYFRGDGLGFSYRLPTDPAGGQDYLVDGALQWGATVGQTPTLQGWCALVYVPRDLFQESERAFDLNRDGDTDDLFDVGQLHRRSWSTNAPADGATDTVLGPCVVLQERCHPGADLDGDGFEDPLFLWDATSGRLHMRLFVLGTNRQGEPAVRRVESLVFLRNEAGS